MRKALLTLFLLLSTAIGYAQERLSIEEAVNQLAERYDGTEGVECIYVSKGSGLGLVKLMLQKELGRSFMKGVTSITIIEYSEASEETCIALRKELDAFSTLLQEFDVSKEKLFADNDYIRSFAAVSEKGTLSDFVIALENKKSKMVMYMAGEIILE
ncbi:MAG: hypothetical protein IKZ12_07455 [Alistipes sp.]|nr:hypothetical protein [Alistipes sp.]